MGRQWVEDEWVNVLEEGKSEWVDNGQRNGVDFR